MERAVVDAPSVSVQDVSTVSGSTSTIAGIASKEAADLTITTSPASGTVHIVRHNGSLFIAGDASAVAAILDLQLAAVASVGGKWIAVPKSASPYGAIVHSITPTGLINPFVAKTVTATSLLETSNTQATTVLSGPWTSGGASNGWSGLTSLRIDPVTSLPRSGLIELHHGSSVATRAAVFSTWTQPLSVTLPTVSISYDSLTS
jgi:hypothetical protein